MAITGNSGLRGLFDPYTRDQASVVRRIAMAVLGAGTDAQRQTARAELQESPDFTARFSTSNADALATIGTLSGAVSEGVTFPAGTLRTIKMTMRSSNDADTFYQELEQDVYGNDGTTPVLGNVRLKRALMLDAGVYKEMGEVHYAATEAMVEATDGTNSPGLAGAALSSSNSAFTFPPARAAQLIGTVISQDTFAAATGGELRISTLNLAAGTAVMNQIAGDDGAAADAPAGTVHAHLVLWPLAQVALVLSTNDVQVHARTTLADVFLHDLEITIGKAKKITMSA